MRDFRIQCVLRVITIAGTLLGAALLAGLYQLYVPAVIAAAAAFLQVHRLISYVERTNRELSRFLLSIRYDDFSQRFTGHGRGRSYTELAEAFGRVMEIFRRERAEREAQHRYMEMMMQHVGIGLISYRSDGSVELINDAAKRLLRIDRLRSVYQLDRDLSDALDLNGRKNQRLVKMTTDDDELLQLSVYVTSFALRGKSYRLASLQNIGKELDEKEVEAWQKLTRVLTHEIMNSVTPISSLAGTANALLAQSYDFKADGGANEPLRDVQTAVRTIERRSQSLLHFVDAYRRLTRVPQPDIQFIPVEDLFGRIAKLLEPNLTAQSATLEREINPDTLQITADPDLVEQILINLVKNALEATDSGGRILLKGFIDTRSRPVLQVSDNGSGIVPEALDKIFIPFYTTKKEGSGIGLSLSREIMRQHGGTISARSVPGERTTFTLRF